MFAPVLLTTTSAEPEHPTPFPTLLLVQQQCGPEAGTTNVSHLTYGGHLPYRPSLDKNNTLH